MKMLALLLAIVAAAAAPAARAEGPNVMMVPALGHRLDDESLQRGARDFVNYCLSCHSAKYMRYNRLADLGLSEQDIRDNLIFGDAKIGDTMTSRCARPTPRHGSAIRRPTCRSRRACAARRGCSTT